MDNYNITDFEEIKELLRSQEWRSWVKFVRLRVAQLKEKALGYIREGKIADAMKTVAVIDDNLKQLSLFTSLKTEYENETKETKEE